MITKLRECVSLTSSNGNGALESDVSRRGTDHDSIGALLLNPFLVRDAPVSEGSGWQLHIDSLVLIHGKIFEFVEALENLWRSPAAVEVLRFWNRDVDLGNFVTRERSHVLDFEGNVSGLLVDLKIFVLEGAVGEAETELPGRRDVVLVIPSVAEVMLLGESGVPAVVLAWPLRNGQIHLIFNVWHCE